MEGSSSDPDSGVPQGLVWRAFFFPHLHKFSCNAAAAAGVGLRCRILVLTGLFPFSLFSSQSPNLYFGLTYDLSSGGKFCGKQHYKAFSLWAFLAW